MLAQVKRAGALGVNKDLSEHDLPLGAWTDALNVRFLDGYAEQFPEEKDVYGTPMITPYHLLPVIVGDDRHWIYAGEDEIYDVYLAGGVATHTDLTGTVSAVEPNSWTSALIGGIPILNNGTDEPFRWDLNASSNFVTLDNWPSGTTCKSLRVYKQFLIALDVTEPTGGTGDDIEVGTEPIEVGTEPIELGDASKNFPYMLLWSSPAEPGTVPDSWDYADEDSDAGRVDFGEGYGRIIDGLEMGDSFMIYREYTIHRMDLVGGQGIFNFDRVKGTTGAMNRNCIVEVDDMHFVLTNSDIIVHDGYTANSVLDEVVRRYLFKQMDIDTRKNAFVFKNPFFNEVYVCYPSIGSTACDKAVVWNYKDKTVSFRNIPNFFHATYGPVSRAIVNDWDSQTDTWDTISALWNDAENIPGSARVLAASSDDKLYLTDATTSLTGAVPVSRLERQGIAIGALDDRADEFDRRRVTLLGIRARISGDVGQTVRISVGGTDSDPFTSPTYDATFDHVIGTTLRADLITDRRYLAYKIENVSAFAWRLESFDIEFEWSSEW